MKHPQENVVMPHKTQQRSSSGKFWWGFSWATHTLEESSTKTCMHEESGYGFSITVLPASSHNNKGSDRIKYRDWGHPPHPAAGTCPLPPVLQLGDFGSLTGWSCFFQNHPTPKGHQTPAFGCRRLNKRKRPWQLKRTIWIYVLLWMTTHQQWYFSTVWFKPHNFGVCVYVYRQNPTVNSSALCFVPGQISCSNNLSVAAECHVAPHKLLKSTNSKNRWKNWLTMVQPGTKLMAQIAPRTSFVTHLIQTPLEIYCEQNVFSGVHIHVYMTCGTWRCKTTCAKSWVEKSYSKDANNTQANID